MCYQFKHTHDRAYPQSSVMGDPTVKNMWSQFLIAVSDVCSWIASLVGWTLYEDTTCLQCSELYALAYTKQQALLISPNLPG